MRTLIFKTGLKLISTSFFLMPFLFSIHSNATVHFDNPKFKIDSTWNCKLPENSAGKVVKELNFTKAFCEEKTGNAQVKDPGGFCSAAIECKKKGEKTQHGRLMCLKDPKKGCANLDIKRCFSSKDVEVDFATNANRPESKNPLNKTRWNSDKSEILLFTKHNPRFVSRIKGICGAPKNQSIKVSMCIGVAHTYDPTPPYASRDKAIGVSCLGNPTTGMCPDVGKCFAEKTDMHYRVKAHFPKTPPKSQTASVSLPSFGEGPNKAESTTRRKGTTKRSSVEGAAERQRH